MLDLKEIYAKEYEKLLEEGDNKALEISNKAVKHFLNSFTQEEDGQIKKDINKSSKKAKKPSVEVTLKEIIEKMRNMK